MQDEKQTISIMMILAIFVGVLSPLIIYATQKEPTPFQKSFVLKALNFEIIVLLASIVAGVVVPIIGGLVIWILNLIVCIQANNAINSGVDYNFPVNVELIK